MKRVPTIHEIGEALYGSHWQSELARALNMSDRHMRRLAAGDAQLTEGMLDDIGKIARERKTDIAALLKRL